MRISVGGVRDEAEIRGHRRTYIGAMPGTIIRALRDAETKNPVFLIDEIDKMGADWRGDPASAMLEVLDPEQHSTFRDHYLDLPFDLSKVLFICTANQLETIPPPLLDRMDVISLSGYTEEEKLGIAKKYLVPKQLKAHGLKRSQLSFTDKGLRTIIREYTREAGVRQLERQIAAVCRKAARRIAEGETEKMSADEKLVREWLGPRRFVADVRKRTSEPGVATGLAVTAVGGDVLFIEATAYPGDGRLKVTGPARRGDAGVGPGRALVGADARVGARTSTRTGSGRTTSTSTSRPARCRRTGRRRDHDGDRDCLDRDRQAGLGGGRDDRRADTLGSGAADRRAPREALAAQRAGIDKVIFPRENESDLEELPEETRKELEFIPVDWIEEVLEVAFDGSLPHVATPAPAHARAQGRSFALSAARPFAGLRAPGRVASKRAERTSEMAKLQDRAKDRAVTSSPISSVPSRTSASART